MIKQEEIKRLSNKIFSCKHEHTKQVVELDDKDENDPHYAIMDVCEACKVIVSERHTKKNPLEQK